jgi:Ulp1 protease family, C-terminal catalytic domain
VRQYLNVYSPPGTRWTLARTTGQQQSNNHDCGIFVAHNARRFVMCPETRKWRPDEDVDPLQLRYQYARQIQQSESDIRMIKQSGNQTSPQLPLPGNAAVNLTGAQEMHGVVVDLDGDQKIRDIGFGVAPDPDFNIASNSDFNTVPDLNPGNASNINPNIGNDSDIGRVPHGYAPVLPTGRATGPAWAGLGGLGWRALTPM